MQADYSSRFTKNNPIHSLIIPISAACHLPTPTTPAHLLAESLTKARIRDAIDRLMGVQLHPGAAR
jgi:hypothetical protein